MCGIAGIYNEKKDRSIAHDIKKILKKIKHRGPDGKGFFIDKNKLALGNTRLSIQDISRNGNQPIYSACKRYIIVFNGEIYNFKDLKKELIEYDFNTNTDTEVLLYLFIKFGFKCLGLLKGFFSFAIWDRKKEKHDIMLDQLDYVRICGHHFNEYEKCTERKVRRWATG